VVYFILFFDKRLIDDPVGAVPVHLVCGIWGTLAVGLFDLDGGLFYTGETSLLLTQLIGIAAVGIFVGAASFGAWKLIDIIFGLRVDAEEEYTGLDISEHGMEAYPDASATGSYIGRAGKL